MEKGKVGCLLGFSVAAGSVIGTMAATLVAPMGAPAGAVLGAVVGLLVSPVLLVTLARKPLGAAGAMVFFPSIIAAIVAAWSGNPAVTLLSVVVFCGMAVVGRLALPDVPRRVMPGQCPGCGYDRSGLERCPECGRANEPTPATDARRRPVMRRVAIGAALAVGVILPLLLTVYATYDRHRPRTTAEWLERLGHNDMQIQWEARQALAARGAGPLIEALSHPDPGVRRNAALALVTLRDPAASDALTRALMDSDPWVRERARAALDAIGKR